MKKGFSRGIWAAARTSSSKPKDNGASGTQLALHPHSEWVSVSSSHYPCWGTSPVVFARRRFLSSANPWHNRPQYCRIPRLNDRDMRMSGCRMGASVPHQRPTPRSEVSPALHQRHRENRGKRKPAAVTYGGGSGGPRMPPFTRGRLCAVPRWTGEG